MYISLDSRSRQILDFLSGQEQYQSAVEIAKAISCNKNGIPYSLGKISALLEEQNQGVLDKKRSLGVKLSAPQKKWWRDISCGKQSFDYIFTQDERIAVIICLLLMAPGSFSIEQAGELLRVSRNTLFADLRVAKEILGSYKVKLVYGSRSGYALLGREFTLRSLLVHFYMPLQKLVEQKTLTLFEEGMAEYIVTLKHLQESLQVEYIHGVIEKLALILLYIQGEHVNTPDFTPEQCFEIEQSREFDFVKQYFPGLIQEEKVYLCCQLLGSRVIKPYTLDEISTQHSWTSARSLVLYFERLTGYLISNREGLIADLATHITRAIYRYKYGIALSNNLSEEIQREYQDLFTIIQIVAQELSRDIGYPIEEPEVVLLASYFFSHLQQTPFHIEQVPVMLVVENPAANTSLDKEINLAFPMLKVKQVVSPEEFAHFASIQEMILSTVTLRTELPYTIIGKYIEKHTRNSIYQAYQRYRLGRSLEEVDDLMVRLRPFLHRDGFYKAKNEILSFLYGKSVTLKDILSQDFIQTNLSAPGWQQAVRETSAPMVQKGTITERYIDALLDNISMYGSYSYIFPGVYLAHADAVDEVNSLSLGIGVFPEAVIFPGDKPVSLLLVLCPKDKHTHFNAFKQLVGACSHEGFVQELIASGTPENLLQKLLGTTNT